MAVRRWQKFIFSLLISGAPLAAGTLAAAAADAPAAQSVPAKQDMVAAANPYAVRAGLEMLRKGGSAVDAAIATQMVLNLVEPESSGIGGGAFMLVYDPVSGKTVSFDGRETAPMSAGPYMFYHKDGTPMKHDEAIPGGLSVGVPGVLAMLKLAHDKYGKLPWAELFQPAIKLAENGYPVTEKTVHLLHANPIYLQMPDIRKFFTKADGKVVEAGDIMKDPALAKVFRLIAKKGPDAFYHGELAKKIVYKVQHGPIHQGGMTLKDLASYHAVERPAVCGKYRVYKICSMGPPSSGGVTILQILGMLQNFPEKDLQVNSLSEVHLFSQASRLAYADRNTYLGDPAFVKMPVAGMIDPAYLAQRAKLIPADHDMGKAEPGVPPGAPKDMLTHKSSEIGGTTHMSMVDPNGMAVAMTTTVESGFGSKMMVDGFILNNQLTDFTFVPKKDGKLIANAPEPGKRPLSSMSPTIVFDAEGHFKIAIGSPGGPAIIPYVANSLIAMLDDGMTPAETVKLGHFIEMNGPLMVEDNPKLNSLVGDLRKMGYDVLGNRVEVSGLHIVEKVPGGYIGGADPRREGIALGD